MSAEFMFLATIYTKVHRDHGIHTEIANMHCMEIACTCSFYMGVTSADG